MFRRIRPRTGLLDTTLFMQISSFCHLPAEKFFILSFNSLDTIQFNLLNDKRLNKSEKKSLSGCC